MGRSVVLAGAERCGGCRLPPRWCVCGALPSVATATAVDVLMHRREQWRPSSTGALLARAVEGARLHVHRSDPRSRSQVKPPDGLVRCGHESWILHPRGDPPPETGPSGKPLQVILLDGNWREAGEMTRLLGDTLLQTGDRGRETIRLVRVACPPRGRFWVRDQHQPGHASTAEALLVLLDLVGETMAASRLRLHFELHVWATLRARGKRALAEAFLAGSPLCDAIPAVLAALEQAGPR